MPDLNTSLNYKYNRAFKKIAEGMVEACIPENACEKWSGFLVGDELELFHHFYQEAKKKKFEKRGF